MHDTPYGLYLWLGGLILLIVILAYVLPWWQARRKGDGPPDGPSRNGAGPPGDPR